MGKQWGDVIPMVVCRACFNCLSASCARCGGSGMDPEQKALRRAPADKMMRSNETKATDGDRHQ